MISKINERIQSDEHQGEKLISNARFVLALIYIISVPVVSILRKLSGDDFFPWHSNIGPSTFFVYALFLFIYVRKKEKLHRMLK
jgi:hypothetical protein